MIALVSENYNGDGELDDSGNLQRTMQLTIWYKIYNSYFEELYFG